jgi:hypothetical protein
LTHLDVSNNNTGELVAPTGCPPGWKEGKNKGDGRRIFKPGTGGKWAFKIPLGAIVLADSIKNNRAISSVNLLKNDIPMEQAKALASILNEHPTLKSLCGNSGEETELDMSGKKFGADGAIMLAPEIAGNRAIFTVIVNTFPLPIQDIKSRAALDFSGKGLKVEDAIIIAALLPSNVSRTTFPHPLSLISLLAYCDKGAMTSLNLARNHLGFAAGWKPSAGHEGWFDGPNREFEQHPPQDMSGVIAIAGAIKDMRAVSKFTFSGDDIYDSSAVTMETSMTEADFSGQGLGKCGAIMLSVFLPKCM